MQNKLTITPGDDLHLTLLMAPYSLNMVVGEDRQHLLAFGKAAFAAGQKSAAHEALKAGQEPVAELLRQLRIAVTAQCYNPSASNSAQVDAATQAALAAYAPQPAPDKDAEIAALKNEIKLDSEAWAELHTLRIDIQGPDGFTTWKEAAVDERVLRVKAEREIAALKAELSRPESTEVSLMRAAHAAEIAALRKAGQVPEGYKLVPLEPTEEMIQAGCLSQQATPEYDNYDDWFNSHSGGIVERIRNYLRKDFRVMLAAAPEPIAQAVQPKNEASKQLPGDSGELAQVMQPAAQPATISKLPAWQDVLGEAEQLIRTKPTFSILRGTVLENDVPVWIADFALRLVQRERARIRGLIALDRCDGETEYAAGANAARDKYLAAIDAGQS